MIRYRALKGTLLLVAFCAGSAVSAAMPTLTQERWKQLEKVQLSVAAAPKATDLQRFGKLDEWQVADARTGGDCEDLALAARQALLAQGWPLSSLRLALGWTERGQYHTVLSVDVAMPDGSEETYIIDDRFHRVENWKTLQKFGYRWDRRQAPGGAYWVAITG